MDLANAFLQTLSPVAEQRKSAEAYLAGAALQPGFALAVLGLVAQALVDANTSQAAAVAFKNHVKYRWSPSEEDIATKPPIADGEKEQIKAILPGLMLSAPAKSQAQLAEALAIISAADFPEKWPALLPELIAKLSSQDQSVVAGVLRAANAIFKRYRHQYKSDALYTELKYVLIAISGPLLELLQRTAASLAAGPASPEALVPLLETARLACRVFYSLSSQELPEQFEDHLAEWMNALRSLLTFDSPLLSVPAAAGTAEPPGLKAEAVKAAACEVLNLYVEKNEEEFKPFLPTFATDVWNLLLRVGAGTAQDRLAIAGLRFLTTVAKSVHAGLFSDAGILKRIVEAVVIPSLYVRPEDEEAFESNFVDYIRRDLEGSDTETRRRTACELVKALTAAFPPLVTEIVGGYVQVLLGQYAASPATAWQAKDCALYLVVALAIRGKTLAQGATATNELVNVGDFFGAQVLPELQAPSVDSLPVLKADALKFLTTFRGVLAKPACLAALPAVLRLLTAEANVVHSYAAIAIEKLLGVRELDTRRLRFSPAEIGPHLPSLLSGLFGALEKPESGENEYLMRCLVKAVGFSGVAAAPYAPAALGKLTRLLGEVAKNPRSPGFNHYLFEAVAVLIRSCLSPPTPPGSAPGTESGAPMGPAGGETSAQGLESALFGPFQAVLGADVQEFAPYVFQLLALLVELRPPPLPPAYLSIFPNLLAPLFWERPANVPALVRLLQAYLSRAPVQVVSTGRLSAVLGAFQKLLSSKAHDHEGFFVLNALVEALPLPSFAGYLPQVWALIFARLQQSRTAKLSRSVAVFLSLTVAKHGLEAVTASVDAVQAGIFPGLLESVWLPSAATITGAYERKLVAVGLTRVLTDSASAVSESPAAIAAWQRTLSEVMRVLESASGNATGGAAGGDDDGADAGEEPTGGGGAAYAQLAGASRPECDPLPEVQSPERELALGLGRLAAKMPGRIGARVAAALSPHAAAALQGYLVAANVSLA